MKKRLSNNAKHDPAANNNASEVEGDDHNVIVEIENGEVSEQMRVAYARFSQYVLGRLIGKGLDS